MKNKAIFLDRDGVLNEDTLYPHKIEHFKLLPGVIEGLKKLSKDYIFIIITNQSGIGRGIYKEEDFHNFNNHLISELKKSGIEIKKTSCTLIYDSRFVCVSLDRQIFLAVRRSASFFDPAGRSCR